MLMERLDQSNCEFYGELHFVKVGFLDSKALATKPRANRRCSRK
jgi:hypothetical protein